MKDPASPCLTAVEFELILHGTLRPNLARRVQLHLQVCSACRKRLAEPRANARLGPAGLPLPGKPPRLDGYVVRRVAWPRRLR